MDTVTYTIIHFNEDNRKVIESIYNECNSIIQRDLNLNLHLEYQSCEKPPILEVDENNDGIYDLRKTSQSDITLRDWGKQQASFKGSTIILNPETRSGVSAVGSYWKPVKDILVVGLYNITSIKNPTNAMHCFLHEIGHSLGAKHTTNDLDSIMCYGKIETYDYHQKSIEEIHNMKTLYK